MSWLIATTNSHKAAEIAAILKDSGVSFDSPADVSQLSEIVEDGQTFASNAARKAVGWASAFDRIVLADDSGLEVDGLEGAPGVHSSRFSGPDANDGTNNEQLRKELLKVPDAPRTARYRCVIAIACPEALVESEEPFASATFGDESCSMDEVRSSGACWVSVGGSRFALLTFEGALEGVISEAPRGTNGFGYDAFMRLPDGRHVAELNDEEKNQISHRAQALDSLESMLAPSVEKA